MSSHLEEIIRSIDSLIENKDARLSIVVETGYDEAGLVGTSDAYLRLAKVLIEFVAGAQDNQMETWKIAGLQLPGSTAVNQVFEVPGEIVIDTTCLTASETDTQAVADYFREMSPPYSETDTGAI